jgi:hypothetical protein
MSVMTTTAKNENGRGDTDTASKDWEIQAAKFRALFETVEDKANWKNPTNIRKCGSRAEAEALAEAITYFVGGAEISSENVVVSRGYYFYCGA